MAQATGISTSTITRGLRELRSRVRVAAGRVRRPGGGRKRTLDTDPTLLRDLEGLVEPTASGDPDSPLRWTAKSLRELARTLQTRGHRVSHQLVAEVLTAAGYRVHTNQKPREAPPPLDRAAQFCHIMAQVRRFQATQTPRTIDHGVSDQLVAELLTAGYRAIANQKAREGPLHLDRDAQFRHITAQVRHFQAAGQPVISVETKKKEVSRTQAARGDPRAHRNPGGGTSALSAEQAAPRDGSAHFGHREHPDRSMVNAQIGAW